MGEWSSIRTWRWVLVAFGAIAGVVLLASGATLIGAVLLTFALLRLAMLVSIRRRMRDHASHTVGNPMRDTMQRLARGELVVAASAIGVTPDVLRRAVDDGRTIASVAHEAGVSPQTVIDAVARDATSRVDGAVAAGNLAPNRAQRMRGRIPQFAERLVKTTPSIVSS
jgi:hypothetical protein